MRQPCRKRPRPKTKSASESTLLQSALIPDRLPPIAGVDLSAIYVPAALERQVGGDWYEVLELRDGRIFLLVGDVAGHGLDAAVIMNRARQAILGAAVRADDPSSIRARQTGS